MGAEAEKGWKGKEGRGAEGEGSLKREEGSWVVVGREGSLEGR